MLESQLAQKPDCPVAVLIHVLMQSFQICYPMHGVGRNHREEIVVTLLWDIFQSRDILNRNRANMIFEAFAAYSQFAFKTPSIQYANLATNCANRQAGTKIMPGLISNRSLITTASCGACRCC
jgi:hypothetical protein